MTLGFLFGSKKVLQAPSCFLRNFCFARIRMDPLGGQVLHHDCISMIVSRFTTFTENFVICCCQVTKIFCTKYGFASASSPQGPCDFAPFTDLAISVSREVSKNVMSTRYHFCSHSGVSIFYSILTRGLRFYLFLNFWVGLVNRSLRSFLSTCELDTSTEWESIPLRSSLVVGEVDELEEDVG